MKFQMFQDKAKEYRWRLLADNGKIIADSGEGYKSKEHCLKMIKLIRSEVGTESTIEDLTAAA